jgi:hypothetical protein
MAQTRGAACDKIVVLFDIVNTASNGALDVTGCAATFTQPLQNEGCIPLSPDQPNPDPTPTDRGVQFRLTHAAKAFRMKRLIGISPL